MSRTRVQVPIEALRPITDTEAAAGVSDETLRALVDEVMDTPVVVSPRDRPRSTSQRRPALGLAVAGCAAVATLALIGVLAGQGPTTVQPADAKILRGAELALHPTSSLVIESFTTVTPCHGAPSPACRPGEQSAHRFSGIRMVRHGELSASLVLAERGLRPGAEVATAETGCQLYDPATDTIYVSSAYRHDISPGPRPGSYVYRLSSQQVLRDRCPAFQGPVVLGPITTRAPSLAITTAQAHRLLGGTARIDVDQSVAGTPRLRVVSPFRGAPANPSAQARAMLGALRVVGPTIIDGRPAIKLAPAHGRGEYDVAPGTYNPIREVTPFDGTTVWSAYRVLPATASNRSLLDLRSRHPGARIVDSNAGFNTAWSQVYHGD